MDTTVPSLPHLFQQLGLPTGPEEMAAFLRDHQLPAAVRVSEAPFKLTIHGLESKARARGGLIDVHVIRRVQYQSLK